MMTRGQANTLILSWLDDVNAGYFTAAQTNVWLNLAQRQTQMKLLQAGQNFYEKPIETTLVIGQADYLLPSDFVTEHRIEIVTSGTGVNEVRQKLEELTTNQQDFVSTNSGTPTNYVLKKDRFTVSPTPDTALTMRLYYSPLVADMSSDSDILAIPGEYEEYTAIVAAFNGFIKDDKAPANLVMKKQDTEKLLDQMASDRTQDSSRRVVQTQDYDSVGVW